MNAMCFGGVDGCGANTVFDCVDSSRDFAQMIDVATRSISTKMVDERFRRNWTAEFALETIAVDENQSSIRSHSSVALGDFMAAKDMAWTDEAGNQAGSLIADNSRGRARGAFSRIDNAKLFSSPLLLIVCVA
jgi:hypothetical protein